MYCCFLTTSLWHFRIVLLRLGTVFLLLYPIYMKVVTCNFDKRYEDTDNQCAYCDNVLVSVGHKHICKRRLTAQNNFAVAAFWLYCMQCMVIHNIDFLIRWSLNYFFESFIAFLYHWFSVWWLKVVPFSVTVLGDIHRAATLQAGLVGLLCDSWICLYCRVSSQVSTVSVFNLIRKSSRCHFESNLAEQVGTKVPFLFWSKLKNHVLKRIWLGIQFLSNTNWVNGISYQVTK